MKYVKSHIFCIKQKKLLEKYTRKLMNSIKLKNGMDTIFMNSENSNTSDPRKLLLNVSNKINFNRSDKYVALSNLSILYARKNSYSHTGLINLKYLGQREIKNLNYQMNHILYQIFKIILSISWKTWYIYW